ncbi:MAG TPA: M23 family metallopeptidase [Vicinamibacterales bacterium]|nr:M23 family metallopeptidase [Vicinamibacterales bacterium]
MRLSLAVGMVSLACAGVIAQESTRLDVRFLPGNHVYLAQDNRNFALANFVLQNIAIVNTGKQPVVVEVVDGKPRPIFPDRVRVSAIGATVAGQPVRATGEIRVISYQPRNEYHFPLSGRWYVASSSSVRSHHRSLPVHEFALDLIQVGEGGQSFRGEGTAHSDYPGQEFSTYAHLKAASVRVKKGDHVQRGQPIAQVGLSGDGYQPHLHVQLTDSRDANYARGIPLIFADVRPILFSSTIDIDGRRQLQAGEFIETIK